MRSVQTANRIDRLARDIGIQRIFVVANKVRGEHEVERLSDALRKESIIGVLPYSAALAQADLEGRPVGGADAGFAEAIDQIRELLENKLGDRQSAPP